MHIKYNGKQAGPFEIVGGSPQGCFFGTAGLYNRKQLNIEEDDKLQYIDDLDLLELIILTDVLVQYDFRAHVASDIALGQRFLPPEATKTQTFNDGIALWTHQNLMKINSEKSKYV